MQAGTGYALCVASEHASGELPTDNPLQKLFSIQVLDNLSETSPAGAELQEVIHILFKFILLYKKGFFV